MGACGRRERGDLAPCEVDVADERGRERTEHNSVGELLRYHAIYADRRAKSCIDECCGIIDEVIGGDHVQLTERATEPSGKKLLHHPLPRTDERNPSCVFCRYALFRCER